jgi:hypothetical protein
MSADLQHNSSAQPTLAEILAELSAREPIFHRPEFGTSRADFEKMMVDDYWEIGASGSRYERTDILDELERRYATPRFSETDVWETSDFECRRLAPDLYLLTYKLVQKRTRHTRRSTIWQRTLEGWKIVYHQGTILDAAWHDAP